MFRFEDKNPLDQNGRTPFHYAAKSGQLDICKAFVANLDDINQADQDGDTPLTLARENNHDQTLIKDHLYIPGRWAPPRPC